jgi:hypothetical protein
MGRTERRFLGPAGIALLLALNAAAAAAEPGDPDTTLERASSRVASPEAFAERARASSGTTVSGRDPDSWRHAMDLIVLAGTCAIAVAFYSAATARRTDTRVAVRVRRR